jgi:chaperonin cofactor prefoldin
VSCPQELGMLAEDANVYKMIGPVLVRQDTLEARSNVSKRLEFIAGELSDCLCNFSIGFQHRL